MPTVTHPSLTLTTINNTTKLTVAYDVEFGTVDRNLVSLGVEWHPHIDIIGYDGASGESVLISDAFDHLKIPVTVGNGQQVLRVVNEKTVPRSDLQEDSNGDDEIKCSIRIHASGLPDTLTQPVQTQDRTLAG
ncbi:MAG TPA: hypothetical protein VFS23_22220 [Vicinamibacterales bacterium]|nr:hypothetical protein [Vicinamibacterales bacterium]